MIICHEHTPPDQLPVMTRTADIIIVGTGDMSVCLSVCQFSMTLCNSSVVARHLNAFLAWDMVTADEADTHPVQ